MYLQLRAEIEISTPGRSVQCPPFVLHLSFIHFCTGSISFDCTRVNDHVSVGAMMESEGRGLVLVFALGLCAPVVGAVVVDYHRWCIQK